MNWRALAKDRRVWWAAAGLLGAAAGGYVLWRRRAAGGSSPAAGGSAGTDASAIAPGGGYAGFPNTTGTDVATWSGQYSEALQNQLDQSLAGYTSQIRDLITALQQVPTQAPAQVVIRSPKLDPRTRQIPLPRRTPAPGAGRVTLPVILSKRGTAG